MAAMTTSTSTAVPLPAMDELRERLVPLFNDQDTQLVVLFGSMATAATHRRSDIDIAVLSAHSVDMVTLTARMMRLLATDRVDVVDLRRVSPILAMAVARGGKPLFERSPGIFNTFCSRAARMYADTRKLREARRQSIHAYLAERRAA